MSAVPGPALGPPDVVSQGSEKNSSKEMRSTGLRFSRPDSRRRQAVDRLRSVGMRGGLRSMLRSSSTWLSPVAGRWGFCNATHQAHINRPTDHNKRLHATFITQPVGKVTMERGAPCQQLEQDGADAPEVCFGVILVEVQNLWGHVQG
jgi:hypothetical protein